MMVREANMILTARRDAAHRSSSTIFVRAAQGSFAAKPPSTPLSNDASQSPFVTA